MMLLAALHRPDRGARGDHEIERARRQARLRLAPDHLRRTAAGRADRDVGVLGPAHLIHDAIRVDRKKVRGNPARAELLAPALVGATGRCSRIPESKGFGHGGKQYKMGQFRLEQTKARLPCLSIYRMRTLILGFVLVQYAVRLNPRQRTTPLPWRAVAY